MLKKWIFTTVILLPSMLALAQGLFKGQVREANVASPIPNATVSLSNGLNTLTNENGYFQFRNLKPGNYELQVSCVGYRPFTITISTNQGSIQVELQKIDLLMQPIEIRTVRAGEKSPFTKTNMTKPEIEKLNLGQDLPFILDQTPSVVVNSDAGNGVGYTAIRIRGTDATRINITLNGIPYNDAESQGSYFVDLPDFVSSVNNMQVQRGVGTSSNGAGAFGATINMSSNEFNEKAYGELNNSFGSFNTWKHTLRAGTGLLNNHFTVDARLSQITSNGFVDRAASNLKSFYVSTAYYDKSSSLRLNIISGNEKTYQAWNGIPEAKLRGSSDELDAHYQRNIGSLYFTSADSVNLYQSGNRTYNYFTYENQTDNYQQDHGQLFFNHSFNERFSFNTAFFVTHGKGYYEEYKPQQEYISYGLLNPVIGNVTLQQTDLIRQLWLNNYYYGNISSLQYKYKGTQWILGTGWNRYDGNHYGKIIWAEAGIPKDYSWYHLDAKKTDFNAYFKLQQKLGAHWEGFADLQYRRVKYDLNGFRDNPGLIINKTYNFINPKLGISYSLGEWFGYLSYALANKEPNRDDFEAGITQQPKPETLHDFEMGLEKRNYNFSWTATLYYMRYRNQLVLTGKVNDVGSYTRTNIPNSYRAGVELQAKLRPLAWFYASASLSLSENKVKDFKEYLDDYDVGGQKLNSYSRSDIALSPSVVGTATLGFMPTKNWELALPAKYVSRQFLDNTGKESRSLNSFYVQNFRTAYTLHQFIFGEIHLILQVNNLFNKKYEPNGYTYSYIYGGQEITENFYYPMATRNFMAGINLKL